MKNYDAYLRQLPLKGNFNKGEIERHPLFLAFNNEESWDIMYFKIDDACDACAVILHKTSCDIDKEIISLDKTYTVKLVYVVHFDNHYKSIFIPGTVLSIYGSENIERNYYSKPFEFENNENFEYDENGWLFSNDRKDLIYGEWNGNFGKEELNGVETIHCMLQHSNDFNATCSICIPESVKKICRLEGNFSDVTFTGKLPALGEKVYNNARFENVMVLTPKDCNSPEDINALMNVPCISDSVHSYYPGRAKEKTLFAAHVLTNISPKSKGYIALTNAKFEYDGEIILVNTPWIATICPKSFRRSDSTIDGSTILIGLKGNSQEQCGVWYDVYELPDAIDKKIANLQVISYQHDTLK